MELVPEVHLEDWVEREYEDCISYTKNNIRILVKNNNNTLQIKSKEGIFFNVKNIENYWELNLLDMTINSDYLTDDETFSIQEEFFLHIRDLNADYETIVFNKETGNMYGTNDLFTSDGWSDEILELMWNRGEVEIIDLLEDINPVKLTKSGWEPIDYKSINCVKQNREESIKILTEE
jgi:hypothetical protein